MVQKVKLSSRVAVFLFLGSQLMVDEEGFAFVALDEIAGADGAEVVGSGEEPVGESGADHGRRRG